jgi:hypothetical protein
LFDVGDVGRNRFWGGISGNVLDHVLDGFLSLYRKETRVVPSRGSVSFIGGTFDEVFSD